MEQAIENSVRKYCLVFASAYALLLAAINLLGVSMGAGSNIGILIASGCSAIFLFTKETSRAPNPIEKKRLIWGSILASYLVSIAMLATVLLFADNETIQGVQIVFKQISIPMLIGVLLMVTAIYYFCLKIVYGYVGIKLLQKVNKGNVP